MAESSCRLTGIAGRVLSGTLTLGQLRRGSGAAPASTPFSFMPLPAAPKQDEAKAGAASKPKTAEQRVCAQARVLLASGNGRVS